MPKSLAQVPFCPQLQITDTRSQEQTQLAATTGSAIFSFMDSLQHSTIKSFIQMPERYECIRMLGKGGMSTVYMARHTVTDKVVAIKFMHPHLASRGKNWTRFQLEAKAAAKIYHPNVLSVYDCGVTSDGRPFLIMDYLEGTTLADLIAAEGPMKPQRAVAAFLQICRGLASAHQNGVIHRDLKPGNIMVIATGNDEDHLQIVDFGIAKLLPQEGVSGHLTQTGEVFGSPLYMSPEQCTGQRLDLRSDVYSMGCLMYETLTGSAPFVGDSYLDTMYKQMHEVVPNVCTNDRRGNVYRRLAQIISKALEKDACDRYQSMEELEADLLLAVEEHGFAWLTTSRAGKDACRRWRKAHRKQLALLSVLVAVALCSILTSAACICVNSLLERLDCVPDASKGVLYELWDRSASRIEPEEAETRIKMSSIAIRQANLKFQTQSELYLFELCGALEARGTMLMRNGLAFRGSRDFIRALSLMRNALGTRCSTCLLYAHLQIDCANYESAIGQLKDAEARYKMALPTLRASDEILTISPMLSLARVKAMQGEYLQAAGCYNSVTSITSMGTSNCARIRFPNFDYANVWDSANCLTADSYRLAACKGDRQNKGGSPELIRAAAIRYERGIAWCKWDQLRTKTNHHNSLAKLYWGLALLHAQSGDQTGSSSDFVNALTYANSIPGANGYKLRAMILKAYTQAIRCHDPIHAVWLAVQANHCWSQYKSME